MPVGEQPVYIYIWPLVDTVTSSEERLLSCAGAYAEAAGVAGAGIFLGPRQPAIARDPGGKPFFPALPDLHFSLSHSGNYCACAFCSRPVGLDLQIHAECRREAVARRCFHPAEYDYLARGDFADFFRVWAAKESYVKYTGAGIAGGLDRFCVVDGGGLVDKMGDVEFYRAETPENYSLCLCAAAIPGVRTVCCP